MESELPEISRYQLHLAVEDCIACDQCARICPVNCIDIESIRAVSDLGTTADGAKKKFYLSKFNIDLAKCFYCGLCTVVCPTDCLTMLPIYDFPTTNLECLNFPFGNLTEQEKSQKLAELSEFEATKKAMKSGSAKTDSVSTDSKITDEG